jgi:hypothetical protein
LRLGTSITRKHLRRSKHCGTTKREREGKCISHVITKKRRFNPTNSSLKSYVTFVWDTSRLINPGTKDEPAYHSRALGIMVEHVFGAGELTCHHTLYVLAMLGLVPDSVLGYAEFASTTHTSRFLDEKFNLFDGDTYCEDSWKALSALFFYLSIPVSKGEHASSKFVQGQSKSRWQHTIIYKQRALYFFDFDGRCVMEVTREKGISKR